MNQTTLPEFPPVTLEQYTAAVEILMPHAFSDTSGSKPAAMVLLSTYNGGAYHIDLTDLCHLDQHLYQAALTVIHARIMLSEEPHNQIENGGDRFVKLFNHWRELCLNDD